MTKEYIEKIASILEAAADYIEATELDKVEVTQKEAAEKLNIETKERDNLSSSLIDKLADIDSNTITQLKNTSLDSLKLMDSIINKTAVVKDDCGEVVKDSDKARGYLDPIAKFAMS